MVGSHCERLLRTDDGLDPIVVPTESPTRVILTVRTEATAEQTAFFDPDPGDHAARSRGSGVARRGPARRGSASRPSAFRFEPRAGDPRTLFRPDRSGAGARVSRSFSIPTARHSEAIWGFWPTAIQLNRREAALHLRKPTASDSDVAGLLDDWARRGVVCGIVTDGPNPVSIVYRGKKYRAIPPRITPVNPIGSGDCLLAGLVDGWLSGFDPEPLFRHASAVPWPMRWSGTPARSTCRGRALARTGGRRAGGTGAEPLTEQRLLRQPSELVSWRFAQPSSHPLQIPRRPLPPVASAVRRRRLRLLGFPHFLQLFEQALRELRERFDKLLVLLRLLAASRGSRADSDRHTVSCTFECARFPSGISGSRSGPSSRPASARRARLFRASPSVARATAWPAAASSLAAILSDVM